MIWNYGGRQQRHTKPLSLYPLMLYLIDLEHSVNVGEVKKMLFIGTPFDVNNWRNLIQIFRSCLCHDRSRCGTHLFPLFRKWHSIVRKQHNSGMEYVV